MSSQQVALVTGATSGIGQATAFRLQARGYLVFAAGRNPAALQALGSRGLQARSLDVTDEADVPRLVEEIVADHGAVDVLVNSAGIPDRGVLENKTLAEVRTLFETHVVAPLHMSQAVLPGMRARGTGTIVNVGSTAGRVTGPAGGAYHIIKHGLEALSLGLRAEVEQFGVRVVLIDPTAVRTPFTMSEFTEDWTYAADDPYAEFMRRRDASVRKLRARRGCRRPSGRSCGRSNPRTPDRAMWSEPPARPRCWHAACCRTGCGNGSCWRACGDNPAGRSQPIGRS